MNIIGLLGFSTKRASTIAVNKSLRLWEARYTSNSALTALVLVMLSIVTLNLFVLG